MLRHIPLSRSLLASAVAVSALAWCQTASAQKLEDGLDAVNKRVSQMRDLITPLLKGEIVYDPKVADHVEAIEVEAKSVIYPFILEPRETLEKEGTIDKLFGYLERDLRFMNNYKDRTGDVSKVYAKCAREAAMEVIKHKNARPIIKVNAARILARLAEMAQPELADDLLDVFKDPKENDGARYWALRGLRDLLGTSAAAEISTVDRPRIVKTARAVIEFLSQKPAFIDATPLDEIEGYRLLRREALRVLAQTRLPMVDEKVRPAVVLARFAGNDTSISPPFQPVPRLDERLDAALGLLRMRPAKDAPGFQSDYTVEQLAHLIAYFATTANKHREQLGLARLRPWKVDAANMIPPLMAFRADVKDPWTTETTGTILRVLQAVANGRQVEADDISTLEAAKAPNQGVFAGAADTVVKPGPVAPLPGEKPETPDK